MHNVPLRISALRYAYGLQFRYRDKNALKFAKFVSSAIQMIFYSYHHLSFRFLMRRCGRSDLDFGEVTLRELRERRFSDRRSRLS